jgi:sugar/nucleoside kinase (ribokinase family)
MNEEEAEALTGENDPLLASDKALDWVDLVLCTAGPAGLYMAGFTEEEVKRKTQHPLLPGAIAEFNQYEFSRAMRHKDCTNPLRVFAHRTVYGRARKDHEYQRCWRRRWRHCCMILPPTAITAVTCLTPASTSSPG